MAVETHTEPQVKALVEAAQKDLRSAAESLSKGHEIIAALEVVAKGINGLASSCRGWGNQLTEILSQIEAEAEKVEQKMLGNGKPEIKESVDKEHTLAVVSAAREKRPEKVEAS